MGFSNSLQTFVAERSLSELGGILAFVCILGGVIIALGAGKIHSILPWHVFEIIQTIGIVFIILGILILVIMLFVHNLLFGDED